MSILKRCLMALCCALIWASAGRADAPVISAADPPEYRQLVGAALDEYAAQRFAESRALFLRAHLLSPNARTERGLGFVAFELREYAECIQHLEAALASEIKPLTDELRAESETVLARALAFVDRVEIALSPASAQATLDGQPLAEVPHTRNGLLILSIGEHHLEFSAEGHRSEQRKIVVRGGEQRTVRVTLADTRAPGRVTEAVAAHAWYRSPWLWTAVGVVLVGAGTGSALALTRDRGASPYSGTTNQTLTGP